MDTILLKCMKILAKGRANSFRKDYVKVNKLDRLYKKLGLKIS